MKINNKGYASTIIMFSILTLFLVSMLMLVKTMNNSSTLNKKITEKVVDNIDYDASGTVQERLTTLENKVSNLKSEVINEIYPVGSIYMSTEDDTIEKVQSKFGGTWEKYSEGRTLIGEGAGTDSNGLIQTFTNGSIGGEYTHKLTITEMPSHNHSYIPSGTIYSTFTGTTSNTDIAKASMDLSAIMASSSLSDYNMIIGGQWTFGYVVNYSNLGFYKKDSSLFPGAQHYHSFTPSGTVSSSFKGNKNFTENIGDSKEFDIQNPYIVVYMYKRIN